MRKIIVLVIININFKTNNYLSFNFCLSISIKKTNYIIVKEWLLDNKNIVIAI